MGKKITGANDEVWFVLDETFDIGNFAPTGWR